VADRLTIQQAMQRLGGEAIFSRLIGSIEGVALATDECGQKGKVTLTITTFKEKGSEKGDGFVGFETRLVAVPPSPSARATGLYVNEDGLYTDDPRQQRMDLRAVPQGQPEARDVPVGQPQARRV
jgi:hypothetical protein